MIGQTVDETRGASNIKDHDATVHGPVLTVYVVWHPGSTQAADLAKAMFRTFCADPEVPASRGLGIPVRFRTSVSASIVPTPVPFSVALHTVVFVLADDLLVADPAWRSYADSLAQAALEGDLVVPVSITAISNLSPTLSQLQAIRLSPGGESEQEVCVLNDAMHDVCQILDPNAAKVKVFLSHAKHDGLEITVDVRRHLQEVARLDDFFDTTDIPDGARFAEFIVKCAGSVPALLAVQTDSYASREWCRLEVLEAKRRRVPIVVLSAVEGRETRSFPYMGNVPVVRWHGGATLPAVVAALLGEVLRSRYFPMRVEAICRSEGLVPRPEIFTCPPELLTVLAFRSEPSAVHGDIVQYLYPDPPLGTEEIELLRQLDAGVEPVTPTMLLAL